MLVPMDNPTSRGAKESALIVVADDYGRWPTYDAGIAAAAAAGAIDAVSAMVLRDPDPDPVLATGVGVGLHLELAAPGAGGATKRRAAAADSEAAVAALREQVERFAAIFGRTPAHLDGHHHCHAAPGLAAALVREAAALALPTRSVSAGHRRALRELGVPTPDRLVGRLREDEPALPPELRALVEGGGAAPPGVTEWMVHPGHPDAEAGSAYDAGREEDLRLVLRLAGSPDLRALRAPHARALRQGPGSGSRS
jgi:chitin disaccharide deacetylase